MHWTIFYSYNTATSLLIKTRSAHQELLHRTCQRTYRLRA